MRIIKEDFGHPAFLPRAGDPAEIGPVIAFVGSRVTSYLTGANINVDGGSDFQDVSWRVTSVGRLEATGSVGAGGHLSDVQAAPPAARRAG
ncbi:hypothetical protein MXD60_10150 [Frankia sp. AgB32]|nr:hypothetical protein [Frankia sp. AgB32]